jgi:hypothetical protein
MPLNENVGELIVKGRVLTRTGTPKFRVGVLYFAQKNYDETAGVQLFDEPVDVEIDSNGAFRVSLYPGTNGDAWVAKMKLTDYNGRVYSDYRVLPAEGEVDFFRAAKAISTEDVTWPAQEHPILVSDYNKPGGPLQLTDTGTIADRHIPGDFLRVNDDRIPELRNYVTLEDYLDGLAQNRKTIVVEFVDSSTEWRVDYAEQGIDYTPMVQTLESDKTELEGALSYPVGTTEVVVQFDAPTSGVMILR